MHARRTLTEAEIDIPHPDGCRLLIVAAPRCWFRDHIHLWYRLQVSPRRPMSEIPTEQSFHSMYPIAQIGGRGANFRRSAVLAASRLRGIRLGLTLLALSFLPVEARTLRVVALGDSLSAGYQLAASDAFPAVLEQKLKARGLDVSIENAGVSGDTATAGLERLDWSVPDGTDAVIVELGANDALRGLDPSVTERALDEIIQRLKARKIAVFLAGMLAPRNNGEAYTRQFDAIFPKLAARHSVPLYPFFLDGVQGEPKLNLADMLHPNPAGVRVIVERIAPAIETFLRGLPAR
jgi:acyl-CoA thioesterase-1